MAATCWRSSPAPHATPSARHTRWRCPRTTCVPRTVRPRRSVPRSSAGPTSVDRSGDHLAERQALHSGTGQHWRAARRGRRMGSRRTAADADAGGVPAALDREVHRRAVRPGRPARRPGDLTVSHRDRRADAAFLVQIPRRSRARSARAARRRRLRPADGVQPHSLRLGADGRADGPPPRPARSRMAGLRGAHPADGRRLVRRGRNRLGLKRPPRRQARQLALVGERPAKGE